MKIKAGKAKENISKIISILFEFLISFVNIALTVFLILGAIASVLLLSKMFPDTALILYKPFLLVFNYIWIIIKIILIVIFAFIYIYLIVWVAEAFKKIEKNNELKKKKFMNEVVIKLKKEMKKK